MSGRSRLALLVSLFMGLAWLGAAPCRAQVEMDLEFEHKAFLVNEAVVARLRVRNVSDIPLVFGGEYSNAKLSVRIRRDEAADDDKISERALVRNVVVMPGDTENILVEFSSQFQMVQTGIYRASVGIEVGGRRYRTRETLVDMVSGIELTHARRPVPGYLDVSYDYSLRYWMREDAEYLFLCVSNKDEGLLYGTFLLGRLLRVHPPQIQFEPEGEIKVVHQSGAERLTVSSLRADRSGVVFLGQEHFRPDGSKLN